MSGPTDKAAPYFGCLGWMLLALLIIICIGSLFDALSGVLPTAWLSALLESPGMPQASNPALSISPLPGPVRDPRGNN